HIAFNDPHVANFDDPYWVKIVDLDDKSRQQQVNDGCFDSFNEVPTHAITLTVPALLQGKFLYCMVPGKNKAKAVYQTLYEEMDAQYPSTILRKHENAYLFIDKESAQYLPKSVYGEWHLFQRSDTLEKMFIKMLYDQDTPPALFLGRSRRYVNLPV